jgi:hypothetical protein
MTLSVCVRVCVCVCVCVCVYAYMCSATVSGCSVIVGKKTVVVVDLEEPCSLFVSSNLTNIESQVWGKQIKPFKPHCNAQKCNQLPACSHVRTFPTLSEYWLLSLPVEFLFVIKCCYLLGLQAKCPCNWYNYTFLKVSLLGVRGELISWGECFILQVLLHQIPLSFEGTGFVDIGLTRHL